MPGALLELLTTNSMYVDDSAVDGIEADFDIDQEGCRQDVDPLRLMVWLVGVGFNVDPLSARCMALYQPRSRVD